MEIEKKFLLKTIPETLWNAKVQKIEQGYLSKYPTIRIRKRNDEHILTIKTKADVTEKGNCLVNQEIEVKILEEEYQTLLEKVEDHLVKKTRYVLNLEDGKKAEVDIFEERLEGLRIVEVEFASIEEAESFVPPSWFGKDVSKEKKYRNTELAKVECYKKEKF